MTFDIPWLRELQEDLDKQINILASFQGVEMTHGNMSQLEEYVNISMESIICSPNSRKMYESLSRIKAFDY